MIHACLVAVAVIALSTATALAFWHGSTPSGATALITEGGSTIITESGNMVIVE